MSNSPYRQQFIQRKNTHSQPINRKPSITDNNTFGVECASFDSIRTDLSIGSKDVIVAEQWLVLGRIGEGSFGEVFEGNYQLFLFFFFSLPTLLHS